MVVFPCVCTVHRGFAEQVRPVVLGDDPTENE
jgi:hypothetical protein